MVLRFVKMHGTIVPAMKIIFVRIVVNFAFHLRV